MQLARVPPPATRNADKMAIFWRLSRGIRQIIGMGSMIMIKSVIIVKILVAADCQDPVFTRVHSVDLQ